MIQNLVDGIVILAGIPIKIMFKKAADFAFYLLNT